MISIIQSIEAARQLVEKIHNANSQDEKSFLSFQLEYQLRKAHAASLRYDKQLRGEQEPKVSP